LIKLGKVKWTIENEKESNNEHFFANNPSSYRNLTKSLNINKSLLRKYGYQKIYEVTHYLIGKRLLEDTINNTKLSFLYNIPIDENISIEIKNYDNVGLYYDLHSGVKNVKKCEECNEPIKVKSNRTKYCQECAKKREINRKREWKRLSSSDLEKSRKSCVSRVSGLVGQNVYMKRKM